MSVVEEEFERLEKQMRNELAKARARFAHAGDKGTAAEHSFRSVIRKYLPRRLAVGHGEVIDTHDNRSGQTDVVIVNEDHPFTFTEDLPGLFFAEGVVGAGEVKSVLTTHHLNSTITNSRKFKALKPNPGKGATVRLAHETDFRYINSPPFFLFAYESDLSLATIHGRLAQEKDAETGEPLTDLVDAVFVLGKGWLINFGSGKESFHFRTPGGEPLSGWQRKDSGKALQPLMEWLSFVNPRVERRLPILTMYTMLDRMVDGHKEEHAR